MKKMWKIIGMILTIFLIVGLVGAYYMGEFLFRNMLTAGNIKQFEQTIQSSPIPSSPTSGSSDHSNLEKTDIDTLVSAVSAKDKLSIVALVTGNLTGNDITTLVQLVRDGELTADEKKTALDLCYQRFSTEEIEKLKSFFEKYKGNISIVP